jgi:energy-coupling factor transporter ATP-binding protein EcfA2
MSNFYNTYNARYLEPNQVAEKFIYSESFEALIKNTHSVILGARGCGKTTLMKMLTLPALHYWKHEKADEIKKHFPFYAVYISTDVYWDVKEQAYDKQLRSFGNFADKISKFSVNSNVFIALCETFSNILQIELKNSSIEKEIELANCLINNWKLNNTIPKLEYVRESLLQRIDIINQLVQDVIFNCKDESEIPNYDFFNLNFDTSVSFVIDVFTRIYDIPKTKKWALCFDELEFAPSWLQDKLYKSLRSRSNQKILYKISSSPILPKEIEEIFKNEYSPSSGNDFDCIKMWNLSTNDEFSRELIESLLNEKFNTKDSKAFFGKNEMYLEERETYDKDSLYMREIKELSGKDFSFNEFLNSKDIDGQNPIPKDVAQKNSIFRKIKPYVYFRNFFIESNLEDKAKPNFRTRNKAVELYCGIDILSKICEGNPRWIIGLTNSILLKSDKNSVHPRIQYDEIINISKRFINSIENIPVKLNDPNLTIKTFIEIIGNYFQAQVLGAKFIMEPTSTFKFDLDSKDYETLLEKGIFQGAFILVDCNDESFDFEILDKKFKLSYLYYPEYRLPIRKSSSIGLSKILKEDKKSLNLFNQEL